MSPSIDLAVVIPTYNEKDNLHLLVKSIEKSLEGYSWEVIFVDDDSPDGTAAWVRNYAMDFPNIRCISRIGRRGLSSACIEGMLSTNATYLAVMDADLQHDEQILPTMLNALKNENFDLAVGTRYMPGGSVGDWEENRLKTSQFATALSKYVFNITLSDPMSGFFMIRRDAFEANVRKLSSLGFKLLLDIVISSKSSLRVKEIAFNFKSRHKGESKLDLRTAWDYLLLLIDKKIGNVLPVSLVSFGMVGTLGVAVHLMVVRFCLTVLELPFPQSQAFAVVIAMIFNFFLNNLLKYRDQKLVGIRFYSGLLKFMLLCGIGSIANVGIASYIYQDFGHWFVSVFAGILVGFGWNYGATSLFVWQGNKK